MDSRRWRCTSRWGAVGGVAPCSRKWIGSGREIGESMEPSSRGRWRGLKARSGKFSSEIPRSRFSCLSVLWANNPGKRVEATVLARTSTRDGSRDLPGRYTRHVGDDLAPLTGDTQPRGVSWADRRKLVSGSEILRHIEFLDVYMHGVLNIDKNKN